MRNENANNSLKAPPKIVVGLSGGVDSSLTAALLKERGYAVLGVTMRLTSTHGAGRDVEDSRAVAEKIGIPYEVWDMEEQYETDVVAPFARSYMEGKTPNPCVNCNKNIKLNAFIRETLKRGYDKLATGHYAVQVEGKLKRSVNLHKDQSYFVASMPPELVHKVIFPLGEFSSKDEVRAEAEKRGLITASKKDSADICFLQEGLKKGTFLSERIDQMKFGRKMQETDKHWGEGNIIDQEGNILGQHSGFWNFTVGQRGGLDLKNPAPDGKPRYVLSTNPVSFEVVVGPKSALSVSEIHAREVQLFDSSLSRFENTSQKFSVRAQIRAHGEAIPVEVELYSGGRCSCGAHDTRGADEKSDEKQSKMPDEKCNCGSLKAKIKCLDQEKLFDSVAAGQSVVLYDLETNSTVLAQGTIT